MAKKEILNNDAVTLRVGESVADILDDTSEVIEQTLDTLEDQVERIVTVTKNNPFFIAGALLVGIGIGGFVAYKLTRKKLTAEFEAELTEQLEAAKVFHKRLAKEGEFESPEAAVQALVPAEASEALKSYRGEPNTPYHKPELIEAQVVEEKVEVEVTTRNVFAEAAANPLDWDYNVEIANREANPGAPYVISLEEYDENPDHHDQASLSYYAEDDTLTDERDEPIDNTDYVVGDDNLTRFGHGSKDANVVYVRNNNTSMDFEIIRSNGSYHKEVLGLDTPDNSLRHSQRRPNRRQWSADE